MAVMAIFGAPIARQNHAALAVSAALGMVEALEEFNQEIKSELGIQLNIGIGINTGIAVAGNMGSESRMNYTVIGDTVNLASRLEGLTKIYKTPIIVSRQTVQSFEGSPQKLTGLQAISWQSIGYSDEKGKLEQVELMKPSQNKQ